MLPYKEIINNYILVLLFIRSFKCQRVLGGGQFGGRLYKWSDREVNERFCRFK